MGFLKKKNILIIIIAAILLIGGGVTAVMLVTSSTGASAVETALKLAEKYLLEQDYEQAIIEFNKVLEIEPMNVDAYIGLADAYIGLGDSDKAIEVLSEGYNMTQDENIKAQLDALTGNVEMPSQEAVIVEEPVSFGTDTSNAETAETSETAAVTGRSDRYPVSKFEYDCIGSTEVLSSEQYQDENGIITSKNYTYFSDEIDDGVEISSLEGVITGTYIFTVDSNGREKYSYISWTTVSNYGFYSEETTYYNERGDVDKKININKLSDYYSYNMTQTYSYEYGECGPISCLCTSTSDDNGFISDETELAEYIYDSSGRLTKKNSDQYQWVYTYDGDTSSMIEEIQTDMFQDIISHKKWDSNGFIIYEYSYDSVDNYDSYGGESLREWDRLPDGGIIKYTNTAMTNNGSTSSYSDEYIRDNEGNRIKRIHTDSDGTQSTFTYTTEYDTAGKEIEREFDSDGVMISYTITEW